MNLTPYVSFAHIPKSFGFTESVDEQTGEKLLMLEGEFQRANAQNRNGRVYKPEILSRETRKIAEMIAQRNGHPMGMDHPIPDGSEASMMRIQRIDMENACALTTVLEMNGDVVYGKAKILAGDYGTGDKLASFVKAKFKPAVSSRGVGGDPVYTNEGFVYVPEDYNQICYDFVTNPSVHNSILEQTFQEEVYLFQQANKYQRKLWDVLIDFGKKNLKREK